MRHFLDRLEIMPVHVPAMHLAHLVEAAGHHAASHVLALMVATGGGGKCESQRPDRQQPSGRQDCRDPSHGISLPLIHDHDKIAETGSAGIDLNQSSKDLAAMCVNRY